MLQYLMVFLEFVCTVIHNSPVENQNDLELDFKVFIFADSCCSDIVLDESTQSCMLAVVVLLYLPYLLVWCRLLV